MTVFCGRLTDAQRAALAPHAAAAVVAYDLGAGNGAMARELLAAGARFVVAVEKEEHRAPRHDPEGRVEWHAAYFAQFLARAPRVIPLALVSWPVNTPTPGLVELCARADVVAYLGKNTDHTVCGTRALFAHLARRPVLTEVRERRNDLVIYGRGSVTRALVAEEVGALADAPLAWEVAGELARILGDATADLVPQLPESPR